MKFETYRLIGLITVVLFYLVLAVIVEKNEHKGSIVDKVLKLFWGE